MIIKIGINGFGRIGRTIFKEAKRRSNLQVVAINDLMRSDYMAYLLKYDTSNGKNDYTVEKIRDDLIVDGDYIKILSQKNPKLLNWGDYHVDAIIESTGRFLTYPSNYHHLKAGASKVIVTDIPIDDKIPMFVLGVNQHAYKNEKIISNASSTTHCIGILAKLLNDHFGIIEGLITNLHSVTYSQNTMDVIYKKYWREGINAYKNIIPYTNKSVIALEKLIPDLKGKIDGVAFRVPVPNVSLVDFSVKLKKKTHINEIYSFIKQAAKDSLKGIIGYTKEPLVYSDLNVNYLTSIFDKIASIGLNDNFFKLIAWYDNETAFSSKVLDLLNFTYYKDNR